MKTYLKRCPKCGKDREIHVNIFGQVQRIKKCRCEFRAAAMRWIAASVAVGGLLYLAVR